MVWGENRSKVRGVIMMTLGRQSRGGVFCSRIWRYRVSWVITPWKMAERSSTSSFRVARIPRYRRAMTTMARIA